MCTFLLQERLEAKKQKIWQKTTPAARMAQQAAAKRMADMQEIDCQAREDAAINEQDDQFTLTVTRSNVFIHSCCVDFSICYARYGILLLTL